MSSHIRYRGFQGNIRQFTAPISFDPQAIRTIMGQAEFAPWRERGVIVSDSLGVQAVKKYFDPTGQTFPHRQVARDALMAGNDLLIIAQFARDDNWQSQLRNTHDALAYFREQYEADRAFAERVDEAALRVIRLKLKLYPEFAAGASDFPPLPEPLFGGGGALTQQIAERATTLLYPRGQEALEERLPHPPLRGEPIVIFTDARRVRDCFDCPYYPLIATDAFQQAILRRYGPEGTNQITAAQIISFSFDDLKLFLGAPGTIESSEFPQAAQERAAAVAALVERAEWVLLVMQDINLSPAPGVPSPRWPESDAARLLLDAATGDVFNKRVVAFFFNVPYQLDTTEISKLSAAYALYSKQPAFIDVAARALFRDLVPQGAPPVTVESVNYDLPTQLEPDPAQPVTLVRAGEGVLVAPTEVEVTSSVILDRNGHPVPDGTLVEVEGTWDDPAAADVRVSTTTRDGIARATLPLARGGTLALRLANTQGESPLLLSVQLPTPTVTATPRATATRVASPTRAATRTAGALALREATAAPPLPAPPASVRPTAPDPLTLPTFLLSTLSTLLIGAVAWQMARPYPLARRVRVALLAIVGGMGGYLLWGALVVGAGG